MSEPIDIVDACLKILYSQRDMEGLRVLVTAGPTREALDPVRFITNRSSGKMGYAIAQAALHRGAEVTLVSGPVSLPAPAGVSFVPVTSTQDLYDAVTSFAPAQDILIQAAAPSDFRPKVPSGQKIKKADGEPLTLELTQTPDVARAAGMKKRPGQVFVGFAAETENGQGNAQKKLQSKYLDLIALNNVSQPGAGFDVDTNVLTLISASGQTELPLLPKSEAAERLLDEIMRIRSGMPNG